MPTLLVTHDHVFDFPRILSATLRHATILLVAGTLFIGCATGVEHSVEYLTQETYPPRSTEAEVAWLDAKPAQPHIELARIVVNSVNADFDTLRKDLMERARKLGADAVIAQVPTEVQSKVGSPNFEAGQFGPKGGDFNLYGYGWYSPNTSNPYLLTQGATDQPRVDLYLTGIAIRYKEVPRIPGLP